MCAAQDTVAHPRPKSTKYLIGLGWYPW